MTESRALARICLKRNQWLLPWIVVLLVAAAFA
jgi:hypothetical protein